MLLASLQMRQELMTDYADLLPRLPPDQWRRIRGEQDIVVRYEPQKALATLPDLLARPADREKLVAVARRLLADERLQRQKPSEQQQRTLRSIAEVLNVGTVPVMPELGDASRRPRPARRTQRGARA
jgi:hypothetical protein